MQINLQSKNIELTEEIRGYALKRMENLNTFVSNIKDKKGEVKAIFEISKSTNHHKAGDIFHADCSITIDGENFYAESDNEDWRSSIDQVAEKLFNEISKNKDRKQTLFRRGAKSIKKMLKGISKRNPFTSKY
ncbi:MAG TPA: ribosome-associated translation inhibitor RaiA [Candidatus Paceibacterota bacterium]